MCGIVCFLGHGDGVTRVLEALHLLEYRAPDSAGLAALAGPGGEMAVRRGVGPAKALVTAMAADPLYRSEPGGARRAADVLARQGLGYDLEALRDCSPAAGLTLHHLYESPGFQVGVGDRGTLSGAGTPDGGGRFSARLRRTLEANHALASPDYDQDAVRHAFRLVAAHVASRAAYDRALRGILDRALLARVPAGRYADWGAAWADEFAANTPGQAFAVAVRHFQETFPGLAQHLGRADWERVGGLTALAMAQIVVGHGRWAMVGAVTEANAHPLLDRSRGRVVCENGSHNASLMLGRGLSRRPGGGREASPPMKPSIAPRTPQRWLPTSGSGPITSCARASSEKARRASWPA